MTNDQCNQIYSVNEEIIMTRYKPTIHIILAVFLVLALALIIFLVISSPNRTLATPDLIQDAFDRGEITAEQRLLYLTYAILEGESLPARFRSKVPWDGTFILQDIGESAFSPSVLCSMSPYVQSEIRRLLRPDTICGANSRLAISAEQGCSSRPACCSSVCLSFSSCSPSWRVCLSRSMTLSSLR
jgi:hypothetical protein